MVSKIPHLYPGSFSQNIKQPNENQTDLLPFNWILKFTAPNRVFKDVSFVNTQVGYIVTELGGVYKTTNGGDNWVSVMNLGFPYYWYGVDAISEDTVIISGFNNQGPINSGVVRWTLNGGVTWTQDIILRRQGSGVGWLDKVHFFTSLRGIVFNALSGACFTTTTGGKDTSSWSFSVINTDGAWIAGNIDAMPSGRVYATGIHFATSTNFGVSWVSGPSADNVFDGGVDFLDNNILFGWTGGGQISNPVSGWTHKTTDGGISWGPRQMVFPYPIRAVKFFNQNTGFAVGGNLFQEAGGIYSTSNGGLNWNLDISTSAEMFSLDYKAVSADSMDIWCVGSTGGGGGYTGKLYKARMQNLVGINVIGTSIPQQFKLYQNYPNPFNPTTRISFDIPVGVAYMRPVQMKVYNVSGQEIETLVNQELSPGSYEVKFDASRFSSGVYFYSLRAGSYNEVKKMIVLK
ncbi:MAG: T9SS type A sorting domain-containing protein [Chlorobi bacterium]|nr:T9SS type A sorting domain-containing protein [Chlorobiota bacterium]